MNEEQKNIETCLAEDILAEVAGVPQDAHFRSLVDEALDPLKQQAATQAGYDDYKEVVQSHQPYTFTSSVRQMKSNLILLLRRLWRYPFGRGTIPSLADAGSLRSLADMWSHYIDRLQGNATYGIPSRLAQLTDLPSAPLLVADRKIVPGFDACPDGLNLARLICDGTMAAMVTKLIDDNDGWVWDSIPDFALFPNLAELSVNAQYVDVGTRVLYNNGGNIRKLTFSKAKSLKADFINRVHADCEFYAPEAEYIYEGIGYPPACKVMYFPKLRNAGDGDTYDRWFQRTADLPTVKFVVGSLIKGKITNLNTCNSPRLIHFEVGADGLGGLAISLDTSSWWNPTYVLSDNPTGTDLIEEGSTAANNLEQFLSNFRDYIAERLSDNGAGKTLTLSQAVFSAVIEGASPICDDIKGIIEDKGWKVQDTNNNIFPTT